jgi:hypothetical protein
MFPLLQIIIGSGENTNVFSPDPIDPDPTERLPVIITLWLSKFTKDAVRAYDAVVAFSAQLAVPCKLAVNVLLFQSSTNVSVESSNCLASQLILLIVVLS